MEGAWRSAGEAAEWVSEVAGDVAAVAGGVVRSVGGIPQAVVDAVDETRRSAEGTMRAVAELSSRVEDVVHNSKIFFKLIPPRPSTPPTTEEKALRVAATLSRVGFDVTLWIGGLVTRGVVRAAGTAGRAAVDAAVSTYVKAREEGAGKREATEKATFSANTLAGADTNLNREIMDVLRMVEEELEKEKRGEPKLDTGVSCDSVVLAEAEITILELTKAMSKEVGNKDERGATTNIVSVEHRPCAIPVSEILPAAVAVCVAPAPCKNMSLSPDPILIDLTPGVNAFPEFAGMTFLSLPQQQQHRTLTEYNRRKREEISDSARKAKEAALSAVADVIELRAMISRQGT